MSENQLPHKPPGNTAVSKDTKRRDPNSEQKIDIASSALQKEVTKEKSFSLTSKKSKQNKKEDKRNKRYYIKALTKAALRHDRQARSTEIEQRDISTLNSKISAKQLDNDRDAQKKLDTLTQTSADKKTAAVSVAIVEAKSRLLAVNQRMVVLEQKIAKLEKHDQHLVKKCEQSESNVQQVNIELTKTNSLLNREHRESARLEIDKVTKQAVADSYLQGVYVSDKDSIEDKAAKLTASWIAEREKMELELDEMDENLNQLEGNIRDTQAKLATESDPVKQEKIKAALSDLKENHKQLEDDRWMRSLNFIGVNAAVDSAADEYMRHQARAERTKAYHQKTKEKISVLETKLRDINHRHAEISEILKNDQKDQLLTQQQILQLKSEYEAEAAQKTEIESELVNLNTVNAEHVIELKKDGTLQALERTKDSLTKLQKQVMGMTQKAVPNLEQKLMALEQKIEKIKTNAPQSPELSKQLKQQNHLIKKINGIKNQISKKQTDILEKQADIMRLETDLNKKPKIESEEPALSLLERFKASAAKLDATHNHHSPHPLPSNQKPIVSQFKQSEKFSKAGRQSADSNVPHETTPSRKPSNRGK